VAGQRLGLALFAAAHGRGLEAFAGQVQREHFSQFAVVVDQQHRDHQGQISQLQGR
jgi:hypothetical protein